MIVFKNYLKIAKSFLPIIIIYTLLFVGIAAITSTSGAQNDNTFEASQAKIAVINHDKESSFLNTFKQYIQDSAKYVKIQDDEKELRDALFFRQVDYIMIIPEGFTEKFLVGQDAKIETMEVPDSYSSTYSQTLMNKYLNTARLYLTTGISEEDMTKHVINDLNIHTEIDFYNIVNDEGVSNAVTFYNFSNFTLLAIIIVVVSMVMITFTKEEIHRRNLISPISYRRFNFQLVLGNVVTSIGVWLLYVLVSIALYGQTMLTTGGLLLMLNSFVFTIFILIFSFFLTTLTQNRQIISGVSTVVGLGTSFISGSFVPQELLSPFVLGLAKLTPSYWFIDANNKIGQLSSYTLTSLQPVFINMLIIIGFAIFFYILLQCISYLKLRKS